MLNNLKNFKDNLGCGFFFSSYRPGSCDSVTSWATVPNITPTSCPGLLPRWCGSSVLLRTHLIGKNREMLNRMKC